MAATATTSTNRSTKAFPRGPRGTGGIVGWFRERIVLLIGCAVLVYTFIPIAYVIALSFNEPSGRAASTTWNTFTWNNWQTICEPEGMCSALKLSFQVSITATIMATLLGTLLAFGIVRHSFRGRASVNILIFLPMATPEVVMGSSLLAMFIAAGFNSYLGFATIVIAHVLFCLSFVVVTVKARLAGMDSRLEQAAMDLYANEWQAFRLITLPLAMPGIVAASLLAFSLSFDDFIVTNFTSGSDVTFPLFIYGAKQRGFPPQVFVIGTLMFLISFVFVIGAELWRRRRASVLTG
ncbi:MAG: ABC transporter permease [Nocardioidaceae bacterium]